MLNQRRAFLRSSAAAVGAAVIGSTRLGRTSSNEAEQPQPAVEILNPLGRVPLSFVIDDSTCLVNMGHYCMPQFAAVWPDRDEYRKPWQEWPREIPDAFVREFGEWCAEHGVKGKYSIVPYPACVGWLDRELPGWSRRQLQDSLTLVRELMVPHWDIHPEMITHTRVIELATGRPLEPANSHTMENSYPQTDKSVDEMASYLAYALRILKNCDLPCEGITTPGGFGNRVRSILPEAVHQAVRDVYGAELPHFFKDGVSGNDSAAPVVCRLPGHSAAAPRVSVSVPVGTGDWFGGWDGDVVSQGSRYCNTDATAGRVVELIERGEPAIMLCHWPGMYCHGMKQGFEDFKSIVLALRQRFEHQTIWMKMSEIARYWAVKELTQIHRHIDRIQFDAPYASDRFTIRIEGAAGGAPRLVRTLQEQTLREVPSQQQLVAGTFYRASEQRVVCWDLQAGTTQLVV